MSPDTQIFTVTFDGSVFHPETSLELEPNTEILHLICNLSVP